MDSSNFSVRSYYTITHVSPIDIQRQINAANAANDAVTMKPASRRTIISSSKDLHERLEVRR
jgi:hypothetical protein